jgi:hypothetical protein
MRFIAWNVGLAGWLLFSAFLLGHGPGSAAFTGLLAVIMGTVALGAPGLPGLRFLNALLACALVAAAFVVEDTSWLARVHNVLAGGIFFALSIIPGRSWGAALTEEGAARI